MRYDSAAKDETRELSDASCGESVQLLVTKARFPLLTPVNSASGNRALLLIIYHHRHHYHHF